MTRRKRARRAAPALLLLALTTAGCTPRIAFGTATKFALDISQRADQTIDVSMGYDRAELAVVPSNEKHADASGNDTYALLGTFHVSYGNPWLDEPIRLNQFFATGMAARTAAKSERFQRFFGHAAGVIEQKENQP
jgi:hypothetical protein